MLIGILPEEPSDETELTAEMSDVWVAPSSDSDEVLPEGTPPIFSTTIVGVGISEADYDADIYQTSTTVSIVSNGNILSTNTATGTFSSVAETQYTLETNFGTVSPEEPEVQYDVQSTHTYSNSPNLSGSNSASKSSLDFGYSFYSYTSAIIWISLR